MAAGVAVGERSTQYPDDEYVLSGRGTAGVAVSLATHQQVGGESG